MITPDTTAEHVLKFSRSFSREAICLIPVRPEHPHMRVGDCFNNVNTLVNLRGGRVVLGFHLTEWPSVFIEAEQHAVWCRKDGTLIDPTPHHFKYKEIAFVADPALKVWKFRDNSATALNHDPLVLKFLHAVKALRQRRREGVVPEIFQHQYNDLLKQLAVRFGEEPIPS